VTGTSIGEKRGQAFPLFQGSGGKFWPKSGVDKLPKKSFEKRRKNIQESKTSKIQKNSI